MTAKGHLLLALAPAIPLSSFLPDENMKMIFLNSVAFGSLLPDIDEPRSYIGRRFGYLSIPLRVFGLRHRTFTHYLIFPLFVAFLSFFFDNIMKVSLLGLSLGIFMHDIGDLLTKGGIKGFLYPFKKNEVIGLIPYRYRFYTNSLVEYIIISILLMIDMFFIYILYR